MTMRGLLAMLSSLLLLFPKVCGDYSCVCNYNVEKSVYTTMSDQSTPVGYMYEFDCKQQLLSTQNLQGWLAVAFEHMIGYVEQDSQMQLQLCPGDPPPADLVTTSQAPVTSMSTSRPHSASTDTITSSVTSSTSIGLSTSPASTQVPTSTSFKVTTSSPVPTSTLLKVTTSSPVPTSTSLKVSTSSQVPTSSSFKVTTSTSIPDTTTNTLSSATSSAQLSTTASVKTAAASLAPSPVVSIGDTSRCSEQVRQFALKNGGILAQFNEACYVLIKQYRHWIQAELDCNTEGGHLVHISNRTEQAYIYSLLRNYFNHSIWIGLSDQRSEAHFEWSSGQRFYFVHWANHTHFSDAFEDCVVMDMHLHDGRWDDRDCTFEFYPYICQYGLGGDMMGTTTPPLPLNSNTPSNHSDGNTKLCPDQIQRTSAIDGTVLGQYERGCYELYLSNKVTWEHGERICKSNGGHLAHISNQEQQAFVEGFMQRHNPNHAVWLGLHDTLSEGTFQWTAGNDVQFTNWIPGHYGNTLGGHTFEDCVVFVPQRHGYWDDVHCGYVELFDHDAGETHYAFCQYKIHNSGVAIVG